jgi:hypothetical protein
VNRVEPTAKPPDLLRELTARRVRATYPVYYSGTSVAGNALLEILGDPSQFEDKRDMAWILVYGDCDAEEGGCLRR